MTIESTIYDCTTKCRERGRKKTKDNSNHRLSKLNKLPQYSDKRGTLVSIHGEREVPFVIRRVFYIYNVDSQVQRGNHANKNSQKVLVCLRGYCSVVLDDGKCRQVYLLNDPVYSLFVAQFIWIEMRDFSPDCLLMVLSSNSYQKDDKITDRQEFLKVCPVENTTLKNVN
jgi:hypothetical protein